MSDVLPAGAHRRTRRLPVKRLLLVAPPVLLLLMLLGVVGAYAATDVPPPDELSTAGVTRVLYADGSEMGRVGGQNRIPVDLDQVPEHVREAVIAAEDRGFYEQPGISPKGIGRALLTNVRGGGEIQQGGSTITQQYAKNAFLSSERTYTRKVKEILIAVKMTRQQSKEEILENYLNTIYFGRGAYGIQVAAQTYFGTSVERLTPAQGAVLAGVIRAPAAYDPEKHPERMRDRWTYVVNGMVETGALSEQEAAALEYPPTRPASAAARANDLSGPKGHVISRVMDELESELQERGLTGALSTGVAVTTTIQKPAQEAAVKAIQDVVGTPKDSEKAAPKGALVSIDADTGGVVAYYGGATGTGFDYAAQGAGRQPGSSFKPFVLATALDQGISLRSRFDGNNRKRFPGVPEPVRNFGDRSFGRVDLRRATAQSVNTAYFELGLEVGPAKVEQMAKDLGITTPLGNGKPEGGIALGTYDVRVQDQAAAYAAFANGGERVDPHFITAVTQDGREIYRTEAANTRAISKEVAADVTAALRGVVENGTGTRAQLDGRPAAGKTGTTSDNFDVWFAGYTPQLATAVWFGTGRNETLELEGVREATGGVVAARAFKEYMDAALEGQPVERFPKAANIGSARSGGGRDDDDSNRPRTRRPRPAETREQTTEPEPVEQTQEPTKAPAPAPKKTEKTKEPAPEPVETVTEEPVETDPSPAPEPTGGTGGDTSGSDTSP